MSATQSVTVASEGLTLSLIVWRAAGGPRPGLVERVLDLNPGLAGRGAILPLGTVVLLPVDPPATAPANLVTLWS